MEVLVEGVKPLQGIMGSGVLGKLRVKKLIYYNR